MFIDLDDFKEVNDDYGHDVGDNVLEIVAKRFYNAIRKSDIIGRVGGDEFILLLPQIGNVDAALKVAENLLQTLDHCINYNGVQLKLSCSIGVALLHEHGEDVDTLMRHADQAMYKAKNAGGNKICLASRTP